MLRQKTKAHFANKCEHAPEDYVGSIEYINENKDIAWLDVYVYSSRGGQEVCIRFGDKDSEYYSAGELLQVLKSNFSVYKIAVDVLVKRGKVAFTKN